MADRERQSFASYRFESESKARSYKTAW